MSKHKVLYGKGYLEFEVPSERLGEVVLSKADDYNPELSELELCKKALSNPIGTERLKELAKGKNNILVIASDHTRPVPSKIMMPLMLEEIREGNPNANITILISTGTHRATTDEELRNKFGDEIVDKEKIVVHDAVNSELEKIGQLPSGSDLLINKMAVDSDLLVSEGFIEPHFFAGYSGGRKSVFPGITSRNSVVANHSAEFIADENARTGILKNNPIHEEMVSAARQADLAFIFNVVLNSEKQIIHAVAGDLEEAHLDGTEFLSELVGVEPEKVDITITSNGGYPMDQNIYQSVKGMTPAEAMTNKGGVIIIAARAEDGHGGEGFLNTFNNERPLEDIMEEFLNTPKDETIPDQWQSQIFIRILLDYTVIYVSEAPKELVESFRMTYASTVEEAIEKADQILGHQNSKISIIPDGVGVMVK